MNKFFIVTTLILFSTTLFSQGLIWNDKVEAHHKTYDRVSLSRSAVLPTSASLEKYLPYVQDQGNSDMCAAYSIATCRTIVYAKNNEITNIDKISAESYSPYYIYHRAKTIYGDESWDGGMMIYMDQINRYGYAKMKDLEYPYYYPFTNTSLWNFSVPKEINLNINDVKEDKFDYIKSILPSDNVEDTLKDLIHKIKTELSNERPIIFAMSPFPEFFGYNPFIDYWDPYEEYRCIFQEEFCENNTNDISGLCPSHKPDDWTGTGHAMVLIGYDDKKYGGSFQILNSWGEEWGDNGKLWIKYKDFIDYTKGLQSLDKNNKKTIFDIDNSTDISKIGYKKEIGIETKDFSSQSNYKWMLRVPVLGMNDGEYSGEKQNGNRNGQGTYSLVNGNKYEGKWEDNKMNGIGVYTFDNCQYNGEFYNGDLSGEGVWIKLSEWGDTIEIKKGNFINGNFIQGNVKIDINRGVYRASRYEGEWMNKAMHGFGKLSSYIYNGGYEGEFRDGGFHGEGRYLYQNENFFFNYQGDWESDNMHGNGTLTTNDFIYNGEFKYDEFHGYGKMILKDGEILEGEWEVGEFIENNENNMTPLIGLILFLLSQ